MASRPGRTRPSTALVLAIGAFATATVGGACSADTDSGADPTATTVTTSAATAPPALSPDAIPVLRSTALVPAGTEADEAVASGLIESTTVSRAEFPLDGAVTLELIEGRRALADIPPDTIITVSQFSPP